MQIDAKPSPFKVEVYAHPHHPWGRLLYQWAWQTCLLSTHGVLTVCQTLFRFRCSCLICRPRDPQASAPAPAAEFVTQLRKKKTDFFSNFFCILLLAGLIWTGMTQSQSTWHEIGVLGLYFDCPSKHVNVYFCVLSLLFRFLFPSKSVETAPWLCVKTLL